jgi:hypothetical protein
MARVSFGRLCLVYAISACAALSACVSASASAAAPDAGTTAGPSPSNQAGHQLNRLDAASYFDRFGPSSQGEWVPWINEHISVIKAYPTFGDWYAANTGRPVIGSHDVFTTFTQQGTVPLTPTVTSEYVAAVERDRNAGYAGTFMDDINFQGANKPAPDVQPEAAYRTELANLVEAVRSALGPPAPIEINAQYHDIWPLMKAKEPEVERALDHVNLVTKEFGVGVNSGIDTASDYKEFTEYVAALHEKGLHIVMSGDDKSVPGEEYNLATYFLVNDGGDYINQPEESPENWWPGNDINLGSATSPAERAQGGLWKREFTGGVVYTVEPEGETQTVNAPAGRRWLDVENKELTEIRIAPRSGAVLRYAPPPPPPLPPPPPPRPTPRFECHTHKRGERGRSREARHFRCRSEHDRGRSSRSEPGPRGRE